MKKLCLKTAAILVLSILLFSLHLSANEPRVYDAAGLFSPAEAAQLESDIAALRQTMYMDVVVVTTNDSQGKSAKDYADDFYDYGGFGTGSTYDGVLLLIDMDNREVYISTTGRIINYLTDYRLENILDDVYVYLQEGSYYEAASVFLQQTKHYYRLGIPEEQYPSNTQHSKMIRLAIAACAAAGISGFICFDVAARYRRGGSTAYKYPFWDKSELKLRRSEDIFLSKSVTQRHIPRSSSRSASDGGSSTHTSSSGRTHGGGGRKF